MTFVNEKGKKIGESRTVDYERDASLTEESHDRENNYIFNLRIGDKCVKFSAQYRMRPVGVGVSNLDWKIFNVDIPDGLPFSHESVRVLLKEAMEEYGLMHGKKSLKEINIIFSL